MGFIGTILGSKAVEEYVKEYKKVHSQYVKNQESLRTQALLLYGKRKLYVKILESIPQRLSSINNLPPWCNNDLTDSLKQIEDFQKAVEYEKRPDKFAELTDKTGRTAAQILGTAATGTAIATLGPTTAMSIATVVGTASTGTAISALTGAAATNAALAWLGGGAVAAGGAGIAGGNLLLGLLGPIGWTIAGLGTAGGIFAARLKNKSKLKELEAQVEIMKHYNENVVPQLRHLSSLIVRSDDNQKRLEDSLVWLNTVFPKDYQQWNEDQKHKLEVLINIVFISVQLINERI